MFCVVYRFNVKEGMEQQFQEGWSALTKILHEQNGTLGSRLHRNRDGAFIAYAQWPDEKTWDNAENNSPEADQARRLMKESCDTPTEVVFRLNVVEDLLIR